MCLVYNAISQAKDSIVYYKVICRHNPGPGPAPWRGFCLRRDPNNPTACIEKAVTEVFGEEGDDSTSEISSCWTGESYDRVINMLCNNDDETFIFIIVPTIEDLVE